MTKRDVASSNQSLPSIQLGLVLLLSCLMIVFEAQASSSTTLPLSDPDLKPRIAERYGKLPLHFEPNQGQSAPEVKFLSSGPRYGLFLTPTEAVLTLHKPKDANAPLSQRDLAGVENRRPALPSQAQNVPEDSPVALHIKLVGANPHPAMTGIDELPGKVNYLRGNDPKQWHTNVPTYGKVKYAQIYPGIDLVYYGNPQQLEHDFVVAPGASPSVIAMEISGAGKASIDAGGDLVLATGEVEIRLKKPVIYQEVNGVRKDVSGGYVLAAGQRVSFKVGAYDATRPLVIDPVLSYAMYLGGSLADSGYGIAVDSSGSAYVTGLTYSTDFPGASSSPIQPTFGGGVSDAFVAKLNAAGTALVYATYLGGSNLDSGRGIAVDSSGNAYVTGVTYSTDFPTMNPLLPAPNCIGGQDCAFVAKLNDTGTALVYASRLGSGSGSGIAVDAAGNSYVTGYTTLPSFPGTSGSPIQSSYGGNRDAFVAKINAAGSALDYSTYLGGSGNDLGHGIAVDSSGSAYVTGETSSTDFPGTSSSPIQTAHGNDGGGYDAFVAKINAAGSALDYSTYLGGSGFFDRGYGIAVDAAGNAYVTGTTSSTDFPVSSSAIQSSPGSSFVAKINAAGSTLVYSTYLGGSSPCCFASSFGIAVDSSSNAYVTGAASGSDLPGASNSHLGGAADAFVAKINAAGSALVDFTYVGGSGDENSGGPVGGIAVDPVGNAYITGITTSTDFQGASNAGHVCTPNVLCGDAFVVKIGSSVVPPSILSFAAQPTLGTTFVVGVPVAFAVTVADPSKIQSVEWDFNGDGTVDQSTIALTVQHSYSAAGTVTAMVTVIDADGGRASTTTMVTVQSPSDAVATAKALVQPLPLNSGAKAILTTTLNVAARYISRGNITLACRTLAIEVIEVNALVRRGRLSAAAAAPLLGEVQAIQGSLGCL